MKRARAVIRAAIEAGRGRLRFLIGLAALVFIPLGLLDAIDAQVSEIDPADLSDLAVAGAFAEVALNTVSSLLGEVLYAGAVAIAVMHAPPGRSPLLREIVSEIRWLTLIAIDILFVLGMVAGILLLIVPGLIFFARYALAATAAEAEGLGVRAGFRRSAELGRGSRWLVFGLLFVIGTAGDVTSGAAQQLLEGLGVGAFMADWVTSALADVVVNPIWALIALALVLELGGRPDGGPPAPRSAATAANG
jgi:hypothetical protein